MLWIAGWIHQNSAMSSAECFSTGRQLVFHQTGKPAEVLEVSSFGLRPPGEGEVLVRILAAPINPADINTIEGTYGEKPALPAVPGIEGCGVVEKSSAPGFRAGDKVMFLRRASTWSTHTTVPADALFRLPEDIDPVQAAMLKVNPATAWRLLHGFESLRPGDSIVQNLGNSAVGRCVIQIARDLGIRTVSLVRRPEVADELRELGADEVFADDEEGYNSAKEVLGGANAVLAFNAVGGESALRLMKLLREGGTHITYGAMGRKPVTLPNGLLIFRDLRIRGLWVTRWVETATAAEIEKTYQDLTMRVVAGKLVQPVDRTFGLDACVEAIALLDSPDRNGKVLFVPS